MPRDDQLLVQILHLLLILSNELRDQIGMHLYQSILGFFVRQGLNIDHNCLLVFEVNIRQMQPHGLVVFIVAVVTCLVRLLLLRCRLSAVALASIQIRWEIRIQSLAGIFLRLVGLVNPQLIIRLLII